MENKHIGEVKRALQSLAPDAPEAAVEAIFSKPLLNALGLQNHTNFGR